MDQGHAAPAVRLNMWDIAAGVLVGNLASGLIFFLLSALLFSR